MEPARAPSQRIVRPAALPEVLASIGRVAPVAPRTIAVGQAVGRVLADAVFAPAALPAVASAARDGWAVAADQITDASAYAPMPLTGAVWVDAGDPIPAGADAVLPPEAVSADGGMQQAFASSPPGEGILSPGADASIAEPLARRGTWLRASDVAALRACGVERVVAREPNIAVIAAPGPTSRREPLVTLVANAIMTAGGVAEASLCGDGEDALAQALQNAQADAIVTIGGTGNGRNDATIRTVAARGSVTHHGIGIAPGETSAFGTLGETPVLMLPGRLDAALAAWLLLGLPLLHRLSATTERECAANEKLARKIASTIGVAEMILVRRSDDGIVPIASGLFPLQALAQADGYVVVPPESEGFPAGADVTVRALP